MFGLVSLQSIVLVALAMFRALHIAIVTNFFRLDSLVVPSFFRDCVAPLCPLLEPFPLRVKIVRVGTLDVLGYGLYKIEHTHSSREPSQRSSLKLWGIPV